MEQPTTPVQTIAPNHSNEQEIAVLMHLAQFLGIGSMGTILVVVVWMLKKKESALLDRVGKEVLNFHIAFAIYYCAAVIGTFFLIGIPAIIALFVLSCIFSIKAAVFANRGEEYRYPMIFRLIK